MIEYVAAADACLNLMMESQKDDTPYDTAPDLEPLVALYKQDDRANEVKAHLNLALEKGAAAETEMDRSLVQVGIMHLGGHIGS